MWYLCFKINPLSIYSLQPVLRFAPSCSLADCSARWSRPRWITSYGITGTAPCSLTSVTYRCLPGCWCLCLRWWWWWSTKLWSCMRYGMKTRLKGHRNHKEPNLRLETGNAHFCMQSYEFSRTERLILQLELVRIYSGLFSNQINLWFVSKLGSRVVCNLVLVSAPRLISAYSFIAGCEFATRRDRNCSLKQSWGWTLHSDWFHLKTVKSLFREPVGRHMW